MLHGGRGLAGDSDSADLLAATLPEGNQHGQDTGSSKSTTLTASAGVLRFLEDMETHQLEALHGPHAQVVASKLSPLHEQLLENPVSRLSIPPMLQYSSGDSCSDIDEGERQDKLINDLVHKIPGCRPLGSPPHGAVLPSSPKVATPIFHPGIQACKDVGAASKSTSPSPGVPCRMTRLPSGPMQQPAVPTGHAPSTGETICDNAYSSCNTSDASTNDCDPRGERAWAGGIASSRQQVDHMRAQLRSLSSSCDTLEVLAAPLRSEAHGGGSSSKATNVSRGSDALAMAHASAIRAAMGQLASLRSPNNSQHAAVEAQSLARLQDWVADISSKSRGRAPLCAAIADMLEAAVDAISLEGAAARAYQATLPGRQSAQKVASA